jgi:copper(I)-binding protein
MTLLKSLALAATLALLSPPAGAHDGVIVTGAYALTTGTSAAVYLEVENHQDEDDTLLAVATDAARKAMIHHSAESTDGVMTMSETTLPIAGLGFLILQPGHHHVMLMGLTRKLAEGDLFSLTLTFERAGAVTVEVPVLSEPPVVSQ